MRLTRIVAWIFLVGGFCTAASSSAISADDGCSGALDCYTKALVRLQSAQNALVEARKDIESLRDEVKSLKSQIAAEGADLKAYRQTVDGQLKSIADGRKSASVQEAVAVEQRPPVGAYADPSSVGKSDRKSFVALHDTRGTTETIPETDVIKYCSDKSGCGVVIGMYNWDSTGRVASRTFRFFYNKDTKVWRADLGDPWGTKNNGSSEAINNSWGCHFTDGKFESSRDLGDRSLDFGLFSTENIADCFLTLIK